MSGCGLGSNDIAADFNSWGLNNNQVGKANGGVDCNND